MSDFDLRDLPRRWPDSDAGVRREGAAWRGEWAAGSSEHLRTQTEALGGSRLRALLALCAAIARNTQRWLRREGMA